MFDTVEDALLLWIPLVGVVLLLCVLLIRIVVGIHHRCKHPAPIMTTEVDVVNS